MLEKTITAISEAIRDELMDHEAELFKMLDREEAVSIAASISIEGRPVDIDLKVKLSYTIEKRVITHEEKISETQHELFPQGKGVKAHED